MSKRHIYSLDDPIGFGKYSELSINEIAEEDVEYLAWLDDEDFLEFDDEATEEEFKDLADGGR